VDQPFISIVIPLFNKGKYIEETLQSVFLQSLGDWEIIVVDNGSTDNGPSLVKQYAGRDHRIAFYENHASQGPGASRNMGVVLARGEWILFLDADDLIERSFIAIRKQTVKKHPDANIVAGGWQEFEDGDENNKVKKTSASAGQDARQVEESAIAFTPWILHAAIVKRSWFDSERRWVESLDRASAEDVAFWYRIIRGATVAWCDDQGALYRLGAASSRNRVAMERWVQDVDAVIGNNLAYLAGKNAGPSAKQYSNLYYVYEDLYLKSVSAAPQAVQMWILDQAKRFLRNCSPGSMGIIVRKVLGLKWFIKLFRKQ
jgi:glycosyltransferase involved in cell wall biosynthesis